MRDLVPPLNRPFVHLAGEGAQHACGADGRRGASTGARHIAGIDLMRWRICPTCLHLSTVDGCQAGEAAKVLAFMRSHGGAK